MFLGECRWRCHAIHNIRNKKSNIISLIFLMRPCDGPDTFLQLFRTQRSADANCQAKRSHSGKKTTSPSPLPPCAQCNGSIMFGFSMQMSMSNDPCVVFHSQFAVSLFALLLLKVHRFLFLWLFCILCAFGWRQDDDAKAYRRHYCRM